MSGFESEAAGTAATWVAAVATIGVWSYFAGARRVFWLAQYLLAGLVTGYLIVIAVREVLMPQLLQPMIDNPVQPLLWVALLLVLALVGVRWLPTAVASLPVAVLVAATASFALGGAVAGTVLPQMGAVLLDPTESPTGLFNGAVSLLISAMVLVGFLHGTRPGRLGAAAAATGRWLLLGGIGGWLGFLLVSRLALLVDRIQFLLGAWLGLVR